MIEERTTKYTNFHERLVCEARGTPGGPVWRDFSQIRRTSELADGLAKTPAQFAARMAP
jgi:hypothetical protein